MPFKPVLLRSLATAGTVVAAAAAASPADAATNNMFLEIDGIKGEATSDQGRTMIEVSGFSHSVAMPLTQGPSNTSRASGRTVHQNFTITKPVDMSTPTLNLKCSGGEDIKFIKLHVWKADASGKPQKYLQYTLESAIVTSVAVASTGQEPVETVSFSYKKITWDYGQQVQQPGKGKSSAMWSLEENKGR